MPFADLEHLRSGLQQRIVLAEQCAQTALDHECPGDVEGLLNPINRLNKALCRFDSLINEAHPGHRLKKVVLGRYELIGAAQHYMTAGVYPSNQISGLTQGVEREAPFCPVEMSKSLA